MRSSGAPYNRRYLEGLAQLLAPQVRVLHFWYGPNTQTWFGDLPSFGHPPSVSWPGVRLTHNVLENLAHLHQVRHFQEALEIYREWHNRISADPTPFEDPQTPGAPS